VTNNVTKTKTVSSYVVQKSTSGRHGQPNTISISPEKRPFVNKTNHFQKSYAHHAAEWTRQLTSHGMDELAQNSTHAEDNLKPRFPGRESDVL